MSKLDKDEVIAKFTEAYKAANGKEPQIEVKSGWYSVDGGKNIRLAQIEEMLAELTSGSTNTSEAKAEKTEKAAAPKAEKAPKKEKAPAKKAAPKPKASGGFSVKAYWAEKITENNPGSKLPR
ncbi:hypothetical protein KIH87_10900 [Paraneptunicella aestuarii]|uniref:hypothetical protein n=1 Tax=Paraneptunicella aestuarii TaxID=2831148 RepID=UPI001E3406F3|nr:hypothetical protein [Paraneptunicella aestuarii]UAA37246.1 hypothetical protein KIH87_10900 [Paraneptunicella aestuarii]